MANVFCNYMKMMMWRPKNAEQYCFNGRTSALMQPKTRLGKMKNGPKNGTIQMSPLVIPPIPASNPGSNQPLCSVPHPAGVRGVELVRVHLRVTPVDQIYSHLDHSKYRRLQFNIASHKVARCFLEGTPESFPSLNCVNGCLVRPPETAALSRNSGGAAR